MLHSFHRDVIWHIMSKDFTLPLSDGEELQITLYGEKQIKVAPCVIFVHGFKGFKDWGFVPPTGEALAEAGYTALTFNFSHNGIGDDPLEMSEEEKFGKNTFSREIRELNELIAAFQSGFFGHDAAVRLGLLGHSRGGGIALLVGSKNSAVDAVVSWSAVRTFDRYDQKVKSKWRKRGFLQIENKRTGQTFHLDERLLDDVEQNIEGSLNIEKAVRSLSKPLLIVHGEEDESVRVSEGRQLYEWADRSLTDYLEVPATGHTFGVGHPWEGPSKEFELVMRETINFFDASLH